MKANSVVLAIDPGSRETGIVVRRARDLLAHATVVRRTPPGTYPTSADIDEVLSTVAGLRDDHRPHLFAVEGLVEPNPRMGMTNVKGIIGTALVAGAVLAVFDCVVVEPDGHGSHPPALYPEPLRPTRGKGAGRDSLRHCRSAWDIAHAGLVAARAA